MIKSLHEVATMIFKRKRKGITYIYERTTVDGKRHEKVIGKVDKDGKEIYYPVVVDDHASDGQGRGREEGKSYKTKAIAEKNTSLVHCPERLAVPTSPDYQHCISLHHEGKAYLEKLISTKGLEFKDGKMFFEGELEPISTVELQDMRTKEGIEEIDIPLLTMYYSIIFASFMEKMKKGLEFKYAVDMVTRIYAPDLMRCLETIGVSSGANEKNISIIMEKTLAFHNIIGIHHITRNGRPDKSYFPVMNFAGYDAKTNTISFFSPYLNYIVREIYSSSIKLDKKGNPRLKHNGRPMLNPFNSYLIKPSIIAERNKAAVENVRVIIQVIEQTGDIGTPHIKASTIVERNEVLKLRLSNSANPVQLLKRVFTKTWELLRTHTTLLETYDSIVLPDPNDITKIPTPSNMHKLVFEFHHKGKKGRKSMQK